ncbi:hypothetical protein V1264_018584 [Littorina saxatilis]
MATSTVKLFSPRIVAQTGKKCTASVIMLHGSGGTGTDIRDTFRILLREELSFPHIRFIYPTAPLRPYTLAGQSWNVWFDRIDLGLDGHEQTESVGAMATQLGELIDAEVKSGVPLNRIVVGGFSMGGAMALHLGYQFYPQLAGVIGMSSFLYNKSGVYEALEKRGKDARTPPLRQYHGEEDDLVLYKWGKATHEKLTSLGVQGEFVSIPNLSHSLNLDLVRSVREWIAKILPEEHNL